MVPIGFALLLIVATCVIALIYIARKQKALDAGVVNELTVSSESGGTASSTTGSTPSSPKGEKTPDSHQNTIYEYNTENAKRLCNFCDGENSVGAKVCSICGRNL